MEDSDIDRLARSRARARGAMLSAVPMFKPSTLRGRPEKLAVSRLYSKQFRAM